MHDSTVRDTHQEGAAAILAQVDPYITSLNLDFPWSGFPPTCEDNLEMRVKVKDISI